MSCGKFEAVFHEHKPTLKTRLEEIVVFNVEMYRDEKSNGQVFYVRPFSEETRLELERLTTDTPKVSKDTTVTEKDGTYAIATSKKVTAENFFESFWGMLFRKFSSEARRVCVDPITEEKFYAIIFSAEFIEDCPRMIAA